MIGFEFGIKVGDINITEFDEVLNFKRERLFISFHPSFGYTNAHSVLRLGSKSHYSIPKAAPKLRSES